MRSDGGPQRVGLVHVMTVPLSLTFLGGQIRYAGERGFEVTCVCSPGDELDAFGRREGVRTHAVAMPRRITPLGDLRALWGLYRVLREVRPSIVHAHTPKGGLLGTLAAWLAGVPVRIYHMRGLPLMAAAGPRRTLLRWTERVACAFAHRVLCVSHSLREVALDERLCPSSKIRVLNHGSGQGVDASGRFDPQGEAAGSRDAARVRLGIPTEALVVGFVGRIVRDKGAGELVAAWRLLREEFPDTRLLVVGPFEAHDPVAADVERTLRDDPRVHLTGLEWDTPPLYAAMDLLVLPTYREGFPNVLLEASSMGLPVVATRIPGCVDVVEDGITGTLVPPRDDAALAGAIRAYLRDGELRRRHGVRGRERVLRDFRSEDIWKAIHAEYLDLLQARRQPLPACLP